MKTIPFLSSFALVLLFMFLFLASCRPLPDPTSMVLQLEVVDEAGIDITHARINIVKGFTKYTSLLEEKKNRVAGERDYWDEETDTFGRFFIYPLISEHNFEKGDTIFFHIEAFPDFSPESSDSLDNRNGVIFYEFKNFKPRTYREKVVLSPVTR